MSSNKEIVERWFDVELGKESRYLSPKNSNIHPHDGHLNSYGSHFTLVQTLKHDNFGDNDSTNVRAWLLNGDRYSVSTSRHQTLVQDAARATGKDTIIVPFSSLLSASIKAESIVPLKILPERWVASIRKTTTEEFLASGRVTVESYEKINGKAPDYVDDIGGVPSAWVSFKDSVVPIGTEFVGVRHVLGSSVFTAVVHEFGWRSREEKIRGATFLSSFDDQESRMLYFLCELPESFKVISDPIEDAFEALKPIEVKHAEENGINVVRQGDIFAVETDISTRMLKSWGGTIVKRSQDSENANLLGTNHFATEVVKVNDETYARGCLYHVPSFRASDHVRRKMGKKWHYIVKNTVPMSENGLSRSWSIGGNVD